MRRLHQGFSLVSAIFLLVVLAFLGVAMTTFSTTQHQSAALDVMGSRAYQAARAGIEWAAYNVAQSPASAAAPAACATAIPAGTYAVSVALSPKRGVPVPWLHEVPGFRDVQIHSGNTVADTEGCILVGWNRTEDTVQSSRPAFREVMRALEWAASPYWLRVVDTGAPLV